MAKIKLFYIKCFFVVVFIQILNSLQDCQLLPLEILYSRQLFNIYTLAINESFIIVLHKIINSLPVLLFTTVDVQTFFFESKNQNKSWYYPILLINVTS